MGLAAVATVASAPTPAQADTYIGGYPTVITLTQSGSPGPFDYAHSTADDAAWPHQFCDGYKAQFTVGSTAAYPSPAPGSYPGYQTIYERHLLQYLTPQGWITYVPSQWQSGTPTWNASTGRWNSVRFGAYTFFNVPRNWTWRIETEYQWYQGNTRLGRVLDVYGSNTHVAASGDVPGETAEIREMLGDPNHAGLCALS